MAARTTSAMRAVKKPVVKTARRGSAAATSSTSRSTAKKAPAKKAPAKKAAAKKSAPVKKAPVKKAAAKKSAPVKKAAAKKAAAKKSAPVKKAPAKKAAAKKAAAKKPSAPVKQSAATRSTTTARSTKPTRPAPGRKAAPVKMATGAATAPAKKVRAGKLAVRDGEKPWTAAEVKEVQTMLEHDATRLEAEIAATEVEIGHLLREGGEGAGNDQADVGSNTFERDHEMTMAKNARESLHIVESALGRLRDGTYGICESCGESIGKMRLQAFPRATLCMECKQRQERR